MIYAVTGTPGSGKSFYAVRRIALAIYAGKPVATNVPLVDGWAEQLAKRHPRHVLGGRRAIARAARRYERLVFLVDDLEDLERIRLKGTKEGRGVCVLDEAHEWLNSRAWESADRKAMVKFFSTHRHYGWDIYLLTQYLDSIDKQVRDRVEWHIVMRNLRQARVAGLRIFPVNLFLGIHLWAGGPSSIKHIGKREVFRLDRRRRLYDTHGLAFDGGRVPEDVIWLPREAADGPAAEATRASGPPPAVSSAALPMGHIACASDESPPR